MSDENTLKLMKASKRRYLGPHTSSAFSLDPKHLVFTLARYKFVAKMLSGRSSALEVGCGDGFSATIVAQEVERLVGIDNEPYSIENSENNDLSGEMFVHDILSSPYPEKFEAVYSLDVIEHIQAEKEHLFFNNIVSSTKENGILIIGTPNITASDHASEGSRIGHINLKSFSSLKKSLDRYYRNVFMFGMNDEVLHTGFGPMCHYIMALAVQPIKND
jgi:2-polyprenyl-3-methyl-5-hydroxy-6-metoxy-1,4-benzoquinol methylase